MNLPVTAIETPYPKGKILVSKTDLQGVITYANDAFIALSGFSKEELIGKSHHIVRHPDMPAAVFADMWKTIKNGYPFRGLIKNRRKDGGFYWVEAMVVPVYKNRQLTSYMSVRFEPHSNEVQQAERYYAAIRENQAKYTSPVHRTSASLTVKGGILLGFLTAATIVNAAMPYLGLPEWIPGALVVVSAAAALGGYFYATSITRRLHHMLDYLKGMAEGDLTHHIDTTHRDDIGKVFAALASMQVQLQVIIDDIRIASESVSGQITTLETEMNTVVDTMENQKDAVFAATDAMEVSNQSIHEVAENANTALKAVLATGDRIISGRKSMDHSHAALLEVIRAVEKSAKSLDEMKNSLGQISQISQVITDIAEQTNLLALNAAIEAARAGEAGRGFAVVADEVRKLAEKTAGSTSEISTTVKGIENTTQAAIVSMEDAVERAHSGQELLDNAGTQFQAIEVSNHQVQSSGSTIAEATKEQSIAIQDVTDNLKEVARMSEDSVRAATGIKSATESLVTTAADLMKLVQGFKPTRKI